MAAVVKCDCCGNCVEYRNARHVRTYKMYSATTYKDDDTHCKGELCSDCYKTLLKMLGKEGKK